VAERFVRETRRDPLHHGSTEQALYARLESWAAEVGRQGSAALSVDGESQSPTIQVSSAQLAEAAREPLDEIVRTARHLLDEYPEREIHVSERVAGIPGLLERIGELSSSPPLRLQAAAAAQGTFKHRGSIEAPGNELRLITELSLDPTPATATPVFEPYG
jgi:hypothetical protein